MNQLQIQRPSKMLKQMISKKRTSQTQKYHIKMTPKMGKQHGKRNKIIRLVLREEMNIYLILSIFDTEHCNASILNSYLTPIRCTYHIFIINFTSFTFLDCFV